MPVVRDPAPVPHCLLPASVERAAASERRTSRPPPPPPSGAAALPKWLGGGATGTGTRGLSSDHLSAHLSSDHLSAHAGGGSDAAPGAWNPWQWGVAAVWSRSTAAACAALPPPRPEALTIAAAARERRERAGEPAAALVSPPPPVAEDPAEAEQMRQLLRMSDHEVVTVVRASECVSE